MSLLESIRALQTSLGSAATFAATQVLNVCLPGSGAVVDLIGNLLSDETVTDAAKQAKAAYKDWSESRWKADIEQRLGTTEKELEQIAGLLSVVQREFLELLQQVAAQHERPEESRKLIEDAIATHPKLRMAQDELRDMAARLGLVEDQIRRWRAAGLNTKLINKMAGSEERFGRQPKAGDRLDGWLLAETLGRGGMGEVFKATKGKETRAIKVLNAELSKDERFVDRFKAEIKILLKLDPHPNLISILDYGRCEDFRCWYYVMPFIPGLTLEQHLKNSGELQPHVARRILVDLANGLAAAHARNVMHRDIKPINVIVAADGQAVLVDFGIAGLADTPGHTRAAGYDLMFSPPEQISNERSDKRGDIYSLAATAYYALRYHDPETRSPRSFRPELAPILFQDLLTKALASEPINRFPNAQAFRDAIPEAETIVVCPRGGGQYREIADAVRAAKPGAVVLVRPGTYESHLYLDKSVDLIADGPRSKVVLTNVRKDCVRSRAARVTIRGFTICQKYGVQSVPLHAVEVSHGQLVLDNCDIHSGSTACVSVQGAGSKVTLRKCTIHDAGCYGLEVRHGAIAVVEKCEFISCSRTGIEVLPGASLDARDSTFHCNGTAVRVREGRATLQQCIIARSGYHGVESVGGQMRLIQCVVRDNRGFGVVGPSSVEECDISDNAVGGVVEDEVKVRDCQIANNGITPTNQIARDPDFYADRLKKMRKRSSDDIGEVEPNQEDPNLHKTVIRFDEISSSLKN